MGKLYTEIERVETDKIPLNLEEVKKQLLTHKPKGFIVPKYSVNKYCLTFQGITEDKVFYRWDSEGRYREDNWEDFYSHIRMYLTDITFEDFKCYEIHVVQSRIYGCSVQCSECTKKVAEGCRHPYS